MEQEERQEKKKKGGKGKVAGVGAVAAVGIIAYLIGGQGLGFGNGFGLGGNTSESTSQTSEAASEEKIEEEEEETVTDEAAPNPAAEEEAKTVIIRVEKNEIYAGDERIDGADALSDYIMSVNTDETTYILRDDYAIIETYNEAKAVLDELRVTYSEDMK